MMNVVPGLLERWRQYRFQRLMKRVRENSAALGFPLDHLTDEEVIIRLSAFAAAARSFGITVQQAVTAFTNLSIVFRELEHEASEKSSTTRASSEALRRTPQEQQDRPESEP
jgi:hypothetical protein